jgi:hypothetical protein
MGTRRTPLSQSKAIIAGRTIIIIVRRQHVWADATSTDAVKSGPTRSHPDDRERTQGNHTGTDWGIDATWRHSKLQAKRYINNCNTKNDK